MRDAKRNGRRSILPRMTSRKSLVKRIKTNMPVHRKIELRSSHPTTAGKTQTGPKCGQILSKIGALSIPSVNTFHAGAIMDQITAKTNRGMRARRLSDHETTQAAKT